VQLFFQKMFEYVHHVLEIKREEDEDCCLVRQNPTSFKKLKRKTRL